jgi:DNA polymerase III alpha subunit
MPVLVITDEQRKAAGAKDDCNNLEFITQLCRNGFRERVAKRVKKENHKLYADRVKEELAVISELGFVDYILAVWDICWFADQQGIPRGPGRGSVGGCLVAYLVGITEIDPIEHSLFFTRFLSKARAKSKTVNGIRYIEGSLVPDIDLDFSFYRRGEIIDYINRRYPGQTSKLLTTTTFSSKILIKDVLKVYEGGSEEEANEVSSMIEKEAGIPEDIEIAAFGDKKWRDGDKEKGRPPNERFAKWAQAHEETVKIAMSLADLNRGEGQHASAVLIAHKNIQKLMPIQLSSDKEPVSGFDMQSAQELSLKMDILGLRTTDVVQECCKLLGIKRGDIDIHHPSIYAYLQNFSSRYGIFQLETFAQGNAAAKVKPKNFEQLSAVLAIARPGAIDYLQQYCDYLNDGKFTSVHPLVDDILKPTGGLCLFQETYLSMLKRVGLSDEEAENARRVLGKKKIEEVPIVKAQIVERCKANNHPTNVADLLLKIAEDSGGYSFNKCLDPCTTVDTKRDPLCMVGDVRVGDCVRAYDVDSKSDHYVEVKGVHWSEANLYRVQFVGSKLELTCSLEHKLLTEEGWMRKLSQVWDRKLGVQTEEGVLYIESISEQGVQPTVDLEVSHPDHNFYAGGVVVSNSHSSSYAMITAWTLYLKANHPLQFYLSLLRMARHESAPHEVIRQIEQEMRLKNFSLLPPHFIKSRLDFEMEGDNSIRFALGIIRGISEKNAEKLDTFRTKAESAATKFEVFQAAKNAGLHIGLVSALIQAGCLSGYDQYRRPNGELYHSRSRLVLEVCTWNLLTDVEKGHCLGIGGSPEIGWDVLRAVKHLAEVAKTEKGKPVIPERRFNTIKKKYESFKEIYTKNSQNERLANYWYERHILGYSYSETISDIFSEYVDGLTTVSNVKQMSDNSFCRIIGFISDEPYKSKTKKGNNSLKFTVSDETGSLTIKAFNDNIDLIKEQNGRDPIEGDLVVVNGKKMSSDMVFIQSGYDGVGLGIQSAKIFMKLSELKDAKEKEEKEAKTLDQSGKTATI